MPTRLTGAAGSVALLMAGVAAAAQPVGAAVSFVTCPIARDTGPDTDLCFVAEYEGALYALTNPADFGAPQLKHRVLVEGRIKMGRRSAARSAGRPRIGVERD